MESDCGYPNATSEDSFDDLTRRLGRLRVRMN